MKRLRQFFESIVYSGLKPGETPGKGSRLRWLGPLRGPVERFLNGSASSDPFYLTNRTTGQKVRLAVLITAPFMIIFGVVMLAASGLLDTESILPRQGKQLTNAEIAAKMLPNLNKDLGIVSNRELQVLDVKVRQTDGSRITGSVKNVTNRTLVDAEVIFDLTDGRGSRVGAVSSRFARIEPNAVAAFDNTIPQATATYAIVREVHAQ